MTLDLIGIMADWKLYDWVCAKVDDVITNGPGFLVDAVIASNSGGVADAKLYDGYSTSGKLILPLACKDDDMESINIQVPIYYQQGLYINIGSNVGGVLLHWIPNGAHMKGHPDTQEHRGH